MTAKNKLLLSICLLIALIIGVISIISYNQINHSSIIAYQHNLSTSTHIITRAVEQKMQTYFKSLEMTASTLMVDNQTLVINDQTVAMLMSGQKSLGVSNYFIGLPDGSLYDSNSQGLHPTFNAKVQQREWYVKGMSGLDYVVTTPFKATTGQMSISLVVPVKHNGTIVALVGLSWLMNDLTQFINELALGSKIFVAREDGFLMAAFDPSMVGKNLFDERPSYRQYAQRDTSTHSYEVPGVGEFYVVSEKSKALDWSFWAFANWEEIQATSKEAVMTNLLYGLVSLVVGILAVSILIQKLMYLPIGGEPKEIEALVNKIAHGDLKNMPQNSHKSIGVYRSTLLMAEKLRTMINDINVSSNELFNVSSQLEHSSLTVKDSSKSQMDQLELVATAMNEMTSTVAEVAQSAVNASSSSNDAGVSAQQGLTIVSQMNHTITHLVDDIVLVQGAIQHVHKETENVGGILDVIRGIADQTNLLALNAAIEAARAGEHGRGFAVVADEVRSLATKTQQSTNEIQLMIEGLQEQANKSVLLMATNAENAKQTLAKTDEATRSLEVIQSEIACIQDLNHQIATATEEQFQVANEINQNIISVNDLAYNTELDVRKNVNTSESINRLAGQLKDYVSTFKVG